MSNNPHEVAPGEATSVSGSSADFAPDRIGTLIGDRYEIIARRGKSGLVDEYDARDARTGEKVVVRIAEHAPPVMQARFAADMGPIGRLRHPCIADVLNHGTLDQGGLYCVNAPGDGEDVATVLARDGRIPPEDAVLIATSILSGLHAAHKAGVYHGDVRPANIVLSKRADGGIDPKLIRFGLAEPIVITKEPVATKKTINGVGDGSPQIGFGTVPYAAPEQLRGAPANARADVYGVAATLYEMLSGTPPFKGQRDEVVENILAGRLVPLSTRAGEAAIPEALEYAVLRGLAMDPGDRPSTAPELGAALWQALAEARRGVRLSERPKSSRPIPVKARESVPGEPIHIPVQRGGTWIVAGLGLCVIALLGWFIGRGPSNGSATSVPVPTAAASAPLEATVASAPSATAAVVEVPSAPARASVPEPVTRPATVVSTGARQRASGESVQPGRAGATVKPAAPSYRVDDLKEPYR